MGKLYECSYLEFADRVELRFRFPGTENMGVLTLDKGGHHDEHLGWFKARAREIGAIFHSMNGLEGLLDE